MRLGHLLVVTGLSLGLGVSPAISQDLSDQIAARQGQFKLLAHNLGPLVQMAQGNMDYDAARAQAAADNLAALAGMDQTGLWPEGSDNGALDGTRALPAIWADLEDFGQKWAGLGEATQAMQAAAGDGLEAVQANLRGVGAACSACHESYRQSQ